MEKDKAFTVEYQWSAFAENQFRKNEPSAMRLADTRRTFYVAWVQCLLFLKNVLAEMEGEIGGPILEAQINECFDLIEAQAARRREGNH